MTLFDEPTPPPLPWEQLVEEAAGCTACPLWEPATQTVFGEGPVPATIMLVGEQPGDQEDRQGRPFVGPAGGVLDRALAAAGIERDRLYITNAVKHFKFEPRGTRRIHKQPTTSETKACHPWLERELAVVQPRLVVLMGAIAAKSVLGSRFKVTKDRGVQPKSTLAEFVVATIHPSAVLRAPEDQRDAQFDSLVADLRTSLALIT